MVGRFLCEIAALGRGDAEAGERAVLHLRQARIEIVEQDLDVAGERGLERRAGAAERNVRHLQPGELQEPGAGEVRALADAGGGVAELVRIGLEEGDQLGDRLDAGLRMRRDDVRDPDHVGDRLELVRLVGEVLEDAVGDRVRAGIADQDGVAVRLGADHLGRADRAAAAGAVFHDGRLAPGGLQMRGEQPAHDVGRAAGRGRHDEADGFGGLPVRKARRGRIAAAERPATPVSTRRRDNNVLGKFLGTNPLPASCFAGSVGKASVRTASRTRGPVPRGGRHDAAGRRRSRAVQQPKLGSVEAEQLEQRREVAHLLARGRRGATDRSRRSCRPAAP